MNASSRPPLTPFFTAGTRSPALVTLPGRSAPRGARLVRLRVRDRPGSLAGVTRHLAEFGVDVIRVEFLNREAGRARRPKYGLPNSRPPARPIGHGCSNRQPVRRSTNEDRGTR